MGKHAQSIDSAILERLRRHGPGWVFTPSHFTEQGYSLTQAYYSEGINWALQGKNGSGLYNDYRTSPVPVIGVYRWLPDLQVAFLAEIDQAEALAPFIEIRNFSLSIAVVATLFALLIGLYTATLISRPVAELTRTARQIAAGDLTKQARISRLYEIGLLASAFNTMTLRLRGLIDDLEQRYSELQQAQQTLQASEARSRALINGIPDMIFRITSEGLFLDFKAEPTDLAMPAEEIIGSNLNFSPLPSPVVAELLRLTRLAIETNQLQTYEYELPMPSGLQIYETRVVKSGPNEAIHVVRNITERTQMGKSLRESEERNRLIVESALDAVITMDAAGLITGWNSHAEAIFGWSSQEVIGQLLSTTIIPPQHRKAHRCGLERYLKTGKTVISNKRTEITALHRDEYEFPIELTVTPAKSGQTVIFVAFLRDTTEHKQAEQEKLRLSAIEQELEIAHDIQQSLLPPAKPDWPNLDVVCFSAPAREVGGDLYTYHAFTPDNSSGKYGLVVGDVSGKGMPAALIMAVTLASFQSTVVAQELAPGDLLSTLDKVILPYTDATRQNCAMVYAEIDQDVLRVANAGCITPIVKQSDGSVKWVEAAGLPLGMGLEEDFGYEEATLNVSKGDVIVLTSDGVVEATNTTDELFEFDRLEQVVAAGPTTSAQAMLDHIRAEVNRFIGDMELQDDVTIVVVKV